MLHLTLKLLKNGGVWLEITYLIIPTINDSKEEIKEMINWVLNNLGDEVPIHFSRFYPQYKLQNLPPTAVSTLRRAAGIARSAGLDYVYIGNVPGVSEENTYCPQCSRMLVGRTGYRVHTFEIENGRCKSCGTEIPGRW